MAFPDWQHDSIAICVETTAPTSTRYCVIWLNIRVQQVRDSHYSLSITASIVVVLVISITIVLLMLCALVEVVASSVLYSIERLLDSKIDSLASTVATSVKE